LHVKKQPGSLASALSETPESNRVVILPPPVI